MWLTMPRWLIVKEYPVFASPPKEGPRPYEGGFACRGAAVQRWLADPKLRLARRSDEEQRICGVSLRQLIQQNHIEQRLMHADAAVIFNQAELPEAIHEKVEIGRAS